jgi:hypothetical protein
MIVVEDPAQAFRRLSRRGRGIAGDCHRVDHRADRAERRGQDHAVQRDRRALPPTSGRVLMDGEDITGLPPHELFHKGLLRTFQIAHEFGSMTVRENLMMVPGAQMGETLWNAWFRRRAVAAEERRVCAPRPMRCWSS